jgi:hypothetical protein
LTGVDAATIRPATLSDVPALSGLAKRAWSDAFGDSVSPGDAAVELEETRSEAYFVDALRYKTILVAEEDGAVLGYVQVGDVDTAIHLYESFGFRQVGVTTFTIGSEVVEGLVMLLDRSDAARSA